MPSSQEPLFRQFRLNTPLDDPAVTRGADQLLRAPIVASVRIFVAQVQERRCRVPLLTPADGAIPSNLGGRNWPRAQRDFQVSRGGAPNMETSSLTFLLFTMFSGLRIFSYVPQIRRVARDVNGASAISYSTWALWTGANIATALYALTNLGEIYLAFVSTVYAGCCITVIVLTMLKRRGVGSSFAQPRHHVVPSKSLAVQSSSFSPRAAEGSRPAETSPPLPPRARECVLL